MYKSRDDFVTCRSFEGIPGDISATAITSTHARIKNLTSSTPVAVGNSLHTENVAAGTYTNASLTVDSIGHITAVSDGLSASVSADPTNEISGQAKAGSATTYMRSDAAPALADTGVVAGDYNNATITVDSQGRITTAISGENTTNSHDIDGAISIGLNTAGSHTTADPGVAIGQRVLGSDNTTLLSLEKSVLIGSDIFPAATTSHSIEDSVVIGNNIGTATGAAPGQRNVLIGSSCATNLNQNSECVILGASAGKSANILSGTTVVGGSAGRKHSINTNTHTVSGGAILIGQNCGRNESSNNTRTIGIDSVLVGCGSFTASDANPPQNSVCVGKGSMSLLQNNTTGQICLGGSNYNSCLIDTYTCTTLRTDSLDNLRTSSTSTILSCAGTADTHVIAQLAGGVARVDFTRIAYKFTNVPVVTNRHITDHQGKSICGVGNSYWVSGASNILSPDEVRRITLTPNMVVPEDDTTSKSIISVGGTAPTTDNEAPSNVTASNARVLGAARVGGVSNMLVYLPRPPQGWKATSLYISLFDRDSLTLSSSDIEVFSRNYITTQSASPAVSDHLTIHVDIDLGKKSNSVVPLTVPYTPTGDDYLVAYISESDNNLCFVGGYLDIERV